MVDAHYEKDVIRPILHARMFGWQDDIEKVVLNKVSASEFQDTAGNGMSVAALCKVLYPLVPNMCKRARREQRTSCNFSLCPMPARCHLAGAVYM